MVCAIVLWYLHKYGPNTTHGRFTSLAKLAASNLLCPSAQDTAFLTPPKACDDKAAAVTDSHTIKTHNLWVFRQYHPAFPYTSLYTGSVHPGVKQIPDISKVCRGCQSLRAEEAWANQLCASRTGRWLSFNREWHAVQGVWNVVEAIGESGGCNHTRNGHEDVWMFGVTRGDSNCEEKTCPHT